MVATMRVTSEQRHTRRNPCPVCGGGHDDPHRQGIRCYGFTSGNRLYAHCTREDLAGALRPDPDSKTWSHRLHGPCGCGVTHGERSEQSGEGSAGHQRTSPSTYLSHEALPDVWKGKRLALLWAYHSADGEVVYEIRRYNGADGAKVYVPFTPLRDGRWVPKLNTERVLYRLPELTAAPLDAPVIVCEGEKCADAARVALRVVGTNWPVTTTSFGAKSGHLTPLDALNGHQVVVLPDHDDDGSVYAKTIATRAQAAGATKVAIAQLEGLKPHGDVADWLAAGHDGSELAGVITGALAGDCWTDGSSGSYKATGGGLWRIKREVDQAGAPKETLIPLTNFTARISADVLEDDGAETRRTFEMEATLCIGEPNRRPIRRFTLPAERFSGMSWPTEHLGAAAIVFPGQTVKEHARVAIQMLSGIVPERQIFTHTGWRQINGVWRYLHAGGATGPDGLRTDIMVTLPPDLARFELPEIPTGAQGGLELVAAVRASLRMLEVAPDVVTVPLYASVWRAALGATDFSPHIAGQTGEGKSELAALAQQHYGAGLDARHLPASWSSSGNALEALAFAAADALLVVDDFIPTGGVVDAARLHRDADRLLRAQGNHSGRQRMRADTSLRPAKPPRGMIVSTGEDTPRGASLRARLLVIEHAPGTMDWQKLSLCQREASEGRYALAMAGFIRWAAAHHDELQAALRPTAVRDTYDELIGRIGRVGQAAHKRTNDNVSQLAMGFACFSRYANEIGALTRQEAEALSARVMAALERVGDQQVVQQAQSEPTQRFLTLISSALASGGAHIATPAGDKPETRPETCNATWGWRLEQRGVGESSIYVWEPRGARIGWLEDEQLYLEPDAAYAAAQRIGRDTGDSLTIQPNTLWKRLHDKGLLASVDDVRQTLKVRKVCEGQRRNILHLLTSVLDSVSPETDPPNPTTDATAAPESPTSGDHGRVSESDLHARSTHLTTNPTTTEAHVHGAQSHLVGLVGFFEDESAGDAKTNTDLSADWSGHKSKPDHQPDHDLLALAEAAGWPGVPLKPPASVAAGEPAWRRFAAAAGPDQLAKARAKLERLSAAHRVSTVSISGPSSSNRAIAREA